MTGWQAWRAVLGVELLLLRRHPRLAVAFCGLLFVPAVYAWIYLYSMWDPASHAQALPAALVNLDQGARYRERELNLGRDVLAAIERHGQFAYRRYDDAEAARAAVRQGRLAFMLEVPADFSRRAVPGERPGAATLTIYTSEGNNYSSAGFARRFAPDVAQRVNTMLGEVRWNLVLSSAEGSRRDLDTLRTAMADLHTGSAELLAALRKAREGQLGLSAGATKAEEAAQRLRGGAQQVADGAQALAGGIRPLGPALRQVDSRRPPEAELAALRQGTRALADGQRELGRALDVLSQGAQRLQGGIGQARAATDELPFSGRVVEGMQPLQDGASQLLAAIERAESASAQLLAGALRLDEGVATLVDGNQRAGSALAGIGSRLPDDARLESFAEGARELARGNEALLAGVRALSTNLQALQAGTAKLVDGAGRLDTGVELVRRSLPPAVDLPGGSAQGLALSVEPVIEVVAPVANYGAALTPNFVPLALWIGAVMTVFLVHLRRIAEPLAGLPHLALVAGKLALPAAVVVLQAALMFVLLEYGLKLPIDDPLLFVLTLTTASLTFLALMFALVRLLGDLGKVVAVLLLIVQVSAAGALLPIELSDEAFQALHPWLPLTWVVRIFRTSLFGAYDGDFWGAYGVVVAIGLAALTIGILAGRFVVVGLDRWRPPLDIE